MWLMLTTGALSVVERDPKHTDKDDTRTLVVRARHREWIDEFRARWCPELGETVHDGARDYQYRAYADSDKLAVAVARVVLAIDYHNFKAATDSQQHGLPDVNLRHSLHDAYSKVWSTMLAAGDGTSAYDNWHSKDQPTGIDACYRWGHWWKANEESCADCGAPNPSYPDVGPPNVCPSKAEVAAWHKAHPEPRAAKAAKPKPKPTAKKGRKQGKKTAYHPDDYQPQGGYIQSELEGSDACSGSWTPPLDDSYATATPDNGYQETAVCEVCGLRTRVTAGDGLIELHWADEEQLV